MGKKLFAGHLILSLFFGLATQVQAASVSREARRYFNRAMAAVEMARTPADYGAAISEFQKARTMAPDWPDLHYNLGLVQEKAGKLRDALASLRRYLQLAPASSDADGVRDLLDRLEYRAEQEVTEEQVLDIFASLGDRNMWLMKNAEEMNWSPGELPYIQVTRDGPQIVVTYFTNDTSDPNRSRNLRVTPVGKTLQFKTFRYLGVRPRYCLRSSFSMEIVSRDSVKVTRKVFQPALNARYPAEVRDKSYIFKRK